MTLVFWLLIAAALAGIAFRWRSWRRRQAEREQAAEARLATLLAEARAAAEQQKDRLGKR